MKEKTESKPRLIRANNHLKSYGRLNELGVTHDPDKHLSFTRKSKTCRNSIIEILKSDFLFNSNFKTFLFIASGYDDLGRFANLPFNNIICVDYQISEYQTIKISDNKRIYCIPTDVITGFFILNKVGVIVDVLCDNNSGENLGFGSGYCLSSQLVLSTGFNIFNKKQLIIIGSRAYQKLNSNYLIAKNYLKIGYSERKIIRNEELVKYGIDFDTQILTLYPHSSSTIDFYLLSNSIQISESIFSYKGKTIHLIRGNIFSDIENFDIALLIFRSKFQYTHFRNNYSNIFDARGKYLIGDREFNFNIDNELILAIEGMACKKIAFIPQNDKTKDWVGLLNSLCMCKSLSDIFFFHIDINDYSKLYQMQQN
jgi:hypothetical protein